MSNFPAIAGVTATLQRILQEAVQEDIYGARVRTDRPNKLNEGPPETCVNIYLYHAVLNKAHRNTDTTVRRPKGELTKRTQVALDLHYLLSFYGNDTELEPQRLMCSVVRTLQEQFQITRDMIQDTILTDPNLNFLGETNLPEQIEPIFISQTDISLENLSKLWSVFFQTPYTFSMTYKASVIFVESKETGVRALPVRDRRPLVFPFHQIEVEKVIAQSGALDPIVADSTLLIIGKHLYSSNTMVQIGQLQIAPESISDSQIVFPLTSVASGILRAGVESLQVVHSASNHPYRGVVSNLATFILRPTIRSVRVSNIQVIRNNIRSGDVTIEFDLTISPSQIVVLILNEWTDENPANYMFKASSREEDVVELTISVERVKAGDYLVRTHVDGAESLLNHDTDSNSPTFNWYISPKITI